MEKRIWHIGSLNVQAGLGTHCFRDYVSGCWRHIAPTSCKNRNLFSLGDAVAHLDFFGVQEIDPGSLRSGFSNQAKWLAEHGKFKHFTHQANRSTGFSVTANALFSKLPFTDVQRYTLPSRKKDTSPRGLLVCSVPLNRFHSPSAVPVHPPGLTLPSEPDYSEGEASSFLTIAVAHLSLSEADRVKQAEAISKYLEQFPHLVLLGDFNAPPVAPSLGPLKESMEGHT